MDEDERRRAEEMLRAREEEIKRMEAEVGLPNVNQNIVHKSFCCCFFAFSQSLTQPFTVDISTIQICTEIL